MDFITMIPVLFMLLISIVAINQLWHQRIFASIATMVFGFVTFPMIEHLLRPLANQESKTANSIIEAELSSEPSPAPSDTPVPESPSNGSTPVNIDNSWAVDALPILGAILLGVTIVALTSFLTTVAMKKRKINKITKNDIRNKWVEVRRLNDDTDRILASYELDTFKAVSYPSMNDSRVPATYEMIKKRKVVESIKSTMSNDAIGGGDDLFNRYFNAVNEYHAAVLRAEEQAKLRGIENYTPEEYRLFEKLKGLISHASDPLTPDDLKQSYYHQIEKTARELNRIAGVEMIKTAPMRQLAQNIGVKLIEPTKKPVLA